MSFSEPSARRRFRLLVFDWDGTLMDSAASIVACMRRTFDELGLTAPGDGRLRSMIGLSLDEIMARLAPDAAADLRRRAVEVYRGHWMATFRHQPVLFDGARRALEALFEGDYFLAVATGKSRPGLDRDLETTGLGRLFLSTRTPHEAPSKPHPQMLLDIVDELGVERRETLMIGDTTYDLEMARHAGVAAVAVLTGTQARGELAAWEPLACLGGVGELPAWLGSGSSREIARSDASGGR